MIQGQMNRISALYGVLELMGEDTPARIGNLDNAWNSLDTQKSRLGSTGLEADSVYSNNVNHYTEDEDTIDSNDLFTEMSELQGNAWLMLRAISDESSTMTGFLGTMGTAAQSATNDDRATFNTAFDNAGDDDYNGWLSDMIPDIGSLLGAASNMLTKANAAWSSALTSDNSFRRQGIRDFVNTLIGFLQESKGEVTSQLESAQGINWIYTRLGTIGWGGRTICRGYCSRRSG
ncbi:MAG TPA: hypothetical protein VFA15_04500 [Nitrososphaera sp.]|nr:hypothetical protein [Nitrososphaera sp.]